MGEGDPIAGVVAQFIVWLATQHLEADYRHRCPRVAERFLRWQRRRRRQRLPCDVNAYCRELTIDGAPQYQINDIRGVVRDLAQFLGQSNVCLEEVVPAVDVPLASR